MLAGRFYFSDGWDYKWLNCSRLGLTLFLFRQPGDGALVTCFHFFETLGPLTCVLFRRLAR